MKKRTGTIISALAGTMIGAAGGMAINVSKNNKIADVKENLRKVQTLYMAFDKWLQIKQNGKSLVEYFVEHNYKTIAIYGMRELGERLYDELRQSDIEVSYIIDKNASELYAEIDILTPDEELKPVDVIVVTAIYYFDEINEMLNEKIDYPVISLEDILNEV